jgi:hypothetical protein
MSMKKLLLLLIFSSSVALAQNLRLVSNLPSKLNETSGLIAKTNNSFWTHNDSGDGPILYKIDSNGNQIDSVYLNGITAVDFEDITQDNLGNYYVGDFGNNNHNRTNLVVYKLPNLDTLTGNNITPEAIYFNYPDQLTFPDTNQDKDCEALFHHNGNLYILTKNWGTSGYSKLYQLPDSAGNYPALLLDSVMTPLVTGADIHSSGKLAILSMDRIVIFDNYTGSDFFNGRRSTFYFSLTQKEGVSFLNSQTLYITQENNQFFPGAKLYELNFSPFLSAITIEKSTMITAMPNPASEQLIVSINDLENPPNEMSYRVMNTQGKIVMENSFGFQSEFTLFLSELNPGYYHLQITLGNQQVVKPFIKN